MTASWSLDDVDLVQLDILASRLALLLNAGDVIALSGPLGAGKTTLARALITRLGSEGEVPSPTFALMQRYETPRLTLTHCDFYRLAPSELDELGLDDAVSEGAVIVEWPERAERWLPEDRLDVAMDETATPNTRRIVLTGQGSWAERLMRLRVLSEFLDRTPYVEAGARYLQGDASTRSYARLVLPDRSAILMNAPRQPDGPLIRDGKPYSALVHLAEDVTPFVAVAGALRERGLSAPAIYAFDLDRGFLILEDLGDRVFGSEVGRGRPLAELWGPAVDVLAALALKAPPDLLPIEGHTPYRLPSFDADAMLTEASLLMDWFWPALHGKDTPSALAEEFAALWRPLLAQAEKADLGWVLRDYHSPNLMWLPEREGIRRVGILDFQDALKGPLAYDLVSLLQDARLDVPEALERELLARYCAARGAHSQQFSSDQFVSLYATLGAQRNSKILGIFARLAKRDGKRGYLAHIPRVARYLERDLAHPSLRELRRFYAREFPVARDLPPLVL
ncbi:MAG: tRNA (adenosine(37)-N6)-threonylcarbamoyltransferase complex ATPase subunit type 1 TsaE [Methyloceanibacter sp.]